MNRLSQLVQYVISQFDKPPVMSQAATISVDPVVSEVAAWYEKLRNAMDYRDDDVILRAAIERIIKRRMILGGRGLTIAEPLVRELIWARYFPEGSVPETIINRVENAINLHLKLQTLINQKHKNIKFNINEWIMQLMSSEIADILNPNHYRQLLTNFMYQVYKDKVEIPDDSEETKGAQVFIGVRRTFAKDDLALLRYQLFLQLFNHLSEKNIEEVSTNFIKGIEKINSQINHPLKDKIYTFIKKQTVPFYILEDILQKHKGKNRALVGSDEQLKVAVLNSCQLRYQDIGAKVRRAIVRGIIFIVLTKALIALAIEGTYESIVFGSVAWGSIMVNTLFPPVLMIIAGIFIKIPGRENSERIFERIRDILYNSGSNIKKISIKKSSTKISPMLSLTFGILWLLGLFLVLGTIILILNFLQLNRVSQAVFIFFLAIVSFISFRVNQTAHMYTFTQERQGFRSILFDFLFMPFIHLGRQLTENISRINLLLFVFDLLIETPFKVMFQFFEHWFLYLRTQREKLG